MEQTKFIDICFLLLPQATLKDQIIPIVSILSVCIRNKNIININGVKDIVQQVGSQLDRLFMKKYNAFKLRSHSEGIILQHKIS